MDVGGFWEQRYAAFEVISPVLVKEKGDSQVLSQISIYNLPPTAEDSLEISNDWNKRNI